MHMLALVGGGRYFDGSVKSGDYSRSGMFTDPNWNWWELAEAVDKGVIAGAGMDVFVTEPIPEDHPYLKMQHSERMHLAPHVAWASIETHRRLVVQVVKNKPLRYLRGCLV